MSRSLELWELYVGEFRANSANSGGQHSDFFTSQWASHPPEEKKVAASLNKDIVRDYAAPRGAVLKTVVAPPPPLEPPAAQGLSQARPEPYN